MIPSLSLVLSPGTDLESAESVVRSITTRFELLVWGCDRYSLAENTPSQWLWTVTDIRTALMMATGDLVAVVDAGADLSELGWLMTWAAECPVVHSADRPRGWLGIFRGRAPGITLIRRAELRRLLANTSGRCDPTGLMDAARRAGLAIADPRPAVAA